MSSVELPARRRLIRSRALILMSVALAFYFGFIVLSIYRSIIESRLDPESPHPHDPPERKRANRRLTRSLVIMTACSFAFGWALVPLYSVFCKVAGIGNAQAKEGAAEVREAVDPNREITVEFVADPATVGSFEFRPEAASMRVHPGQALRHSVLGQEPDGRTLGRAGGAEHLADRRRAVFSQDPVLLLQPAAFRGR